MAPTSNVPKPAASPYATGGGGTVLEHRYAATVLAALLVGDPIPGLGEEFTVERVAFQASTESAVDDLAVTGVFSRNGALEYRTLAIGVRHDPTIGPSDTKFVKLVRDCLVTLEQHKAAFETDAYRLAIVVAAHHAGAAEAARLADLARKFATSADFYKAIKSRGRFPKKLSTRLTLLENAIAAAQDGQAGLEHRPC